ncbi:unnamed protein product [Ambrosiozyma monospora]|uniref:Unnamed protein product n=1 Tax=Ambrosiozyma monospora TaxID=43982 RepID=A0ACB5SV37_AMBMO|nr:unnamed protein product [Ambrosiozyma monospora]
MPPQTIVSKIVHPPDVKVREFGKSYKLHKLQLMKSPYFKSAIEWNNKNKKNVSDGDQECVSINVETDDPWITKQSFELLLKRLHCIQDIQEESMIPSQMMATARFFQVDDIMVSMASDWNWDNVSVGFVINLLKMVTDEDYGNVGSDLVIKSEEYLYDNGW